MARLISRNGNRSHAKPKMSLKPAHLIVRCFAEQEKDGSWFAMCLELNLELKDDSFSDARVGLQESIHDHLTNTLSGNTEYSRDLLKRAAPIPYWFRYYWIFLKTKLRLSKAGGAQVFTETLPLHLK